MLKFSSKTTSLSYALLKVLLLRKYILFRSTKFLIKSVLLLRKLYLHTGYFGKCFFVFAKHIGYVLGQFKLTRKIYNSAITLRKMKR